MVKLASLANWLSVYKLSGYGFESCHSHLVKSYTKATKVWSRASTIHSWNSTEWSYKKKKHKKITAYSKYVLKEPTVKRCLLILDIKPLRS